MEKPNQETNEYEMLDKGILNGYETTDEYLLDRALWYSENNKKKLMQARALRRVRRLRAVDEDQRPSVLALSPLSVEVGPSSRNAARMSPVFEEPVVRQSFSSEEEEGNETQSNETDFSGRIRSPETWGFSPISQPTSPVAPPENAPLNTCLVNNIPLMSILSISEPRQELSNSSGTVPKERTRNAYEYNTASDRNVLEVPATPRPLDLTCIHPVDLRVEELLSLTASEISEHGLNLQDGICPSHQTSPITPSLSDMSETIRQESFNSVQHLSLLAQCICSHTVAQNTCANARTTVQPSLRKWSESVPTNSELPPWKRYSRGVTNQNDGTQTLKRPSVENRIEILAVKRIPPDMSTGQMSGPNIPISNNNQEDPCQDLCRKCLKARLRPDSTFPDQMEQPFSNNTEEPMNIAPESDLLEQFRHPMPVNKQILPNSCLERSNSMVYSPDDVNQLRATYRQENRKIISVQTIQTSEQTQPNVERPVAANQYRSTYLTNHQQNTQQPGPNVERSTSMVFPAGDNQLRSTYKSSRQENRKFVYHNRATDEETQTRPSMGRSASMVYAPGQLAQTFSDHRGQILQNSLETDRANQIRCTYPINRPDMLIQDETDSTTTRPMTRSMLRSASMVLKPGQMSGQPFSDYRGPAVESSFEPDNNSSARQFPASYQNQNLERSASMIFFQDSTGSSSQFQPYPIRNLERSASMMFTPGELSQANYAPAAPPQVPTRVETAYQHNVQLNPTAVYDTGELSQANYAPAAPPQVPTRVETAYQHNVQLNPTAVYDTGQMTEPNFVQPNNQRMRPTAYGTAQMAQQNYMQNNIQPRRHRGFYNTGQLGQPNYQHPTQNTANNAPTPHYFTRQVRAALDAARPRYRNGTCMSIPRQQYPPPTQCSAYSGAGAGYPEQNYDAGYGTSAMPPPPIYVCRHCNKTYKTNTGLKNHLRRICERNPYDRYPMT